ncbi:hypothetical protein FQR65_LT03040 [Abscondita terminalis]|nr:hypothetical protein FQR65_LT03040 [Abscondita terminalis]
MGNIEAEESATLESPCSSKETMLNAAKQASSSLLPVKSKEMYEKSYSLFCQWRTRKAVKEIDQNVMLAYFFEKAKDLKASTISMYFMIRSTQHVNENIDIIQLQEINCFLEATE